MIRRKKIRTAVMARYLRRVSARFARHARDAYAGSAIHEFMESKKESVSVFLKSIPENRMLLILAFAVGIGCGFAAVILKHLIHFFEWILTGWFNTPQDSLFYLLYPGFGMLLSYLFVKYLIKDNIGHGVTKVLLAISKNESKIKTHNTWSSIVASSMTIGFGGSVGAEAPIVYTGAAIGSNIARFFGLSYKHMTILLGCGAAGAVAGIFKAPLAGILFTLEILMFNISMTSIIPLLVTAVTATTVSYIFLGNAVQFENTLQDFSIGNLPFYIVLGIACGFVALYFTRTTLRLEDKIKSISNPYKRWLVSAVSLGLLIFLLPPLYGEGYGVLSYLLNGEPEKAIETNIFGNIFAFQWMVPVYFIMVMLLKVYAMTFTNAGGGVGGTFGPTLFVGGVAGFAIVRIFNLLNLTSIPLPEPNFVLAGMAGLMSAVMQAPLTAIFLIAEISGGYVLFIPLIVTSVSAFATHRTFESYSIYTKRIAKHGDLLTHDTDQAVLTLLKTDDLIENDFVAVSPDGTLGDLVDAIAVSKRNIFPVVDSDGYFKGVVFLNDVREIMFYRDIYETTRIRSLMKDAPEYVYQDEKMESVMRKFEDTSAWNLPVLDSSNHYLGFVSKSKIFSEYRKQLHQVSHD